MVARSAKPVSDRGVHIALHDLIALRHTAQLLNLNFQQKMRNQLIGGHLSNLRGRGVDFDEVRAYQAGDDIRHMDWRVTARTGTPHTKLFHEERERPVFLVVDYSLNMFFGTRIAFKSVVAAQAAALLAWAAVNNGDRLGGVIFSGKKHIEFRPQARLRGVLPFLKVLSDFDRPEPPHEQALAQVLLRLRHVVKPGSLLFILSDFAKLDEEAARHLSRLAQHTEVIACLIRDPIEIEPPAKGKYAITNGQQAALLDCTATAMRQSYHDYFYRQFEHLNSVLTKRRIALIELRTDRPVHKDLQYALAGHTARRPREKQHAS